MQIENFIQRQLKDTFQPVYLEVINESHGHAVAKGSETHFKVVIVADRFAELNRVQSHRAVYAALQEALENGVHALAIHTYTPEEWRGMAGAPDSPACLGGKKREH